MVGSLIILTILLFVNISAKEIYLIGFLGNIESINAKNLYDALTIIVDEVNKNTNEFELKSKFFNVNEENVKDKINDENRIIALTGVIYQKNKELLENIKKEIPIIIIGSEYLSIESKPNIFRIAPSFSDLAKILCRIQIAILHKNKFAVLYTEGYDEYQKIAETYKETALKNKAYVNYFRSVDEKRTDFEAILIRIRELKINTIFFAGPYEQAALIAKQSKELNVGADFSSIPVICNKDFIKKAKDGAQGAHFTLPTLPNIYSYKQLKNILEKYSETHKEFDEKLPFLYDAVNLVVHCIKIKQKNLLECFEKEAFTGITGNIKFDENGLRKEYQPYFFVIRRKEFLYRKLNIKERELYFKMR